MFPSAQYLFYHSMFPNSHNIYPRREWALPALWCLRSQDGSGSRRSLNAAPHTANWCRAFATSFHAASLCASPSSRSPVDGGVNKEDTEADVSQQCRVAQLRSTPNTRDDDNLACDSCDSVLNSSLINSATSRPPQLEHRTPHRSRIQSSLSQIVSPPRRKSWPRRSGRFRNCGASCRWRTASCARS